MPARDDAGGRPPGAGPPPDDLTACGDAVAQAALLDELARVVQPGGVLVTSDLPRQCDALHAERPVRARNGRAVTGFLHVGRRVEAPA
jgi:class 3 adenylate cyclase